MHNSQLNTKHLSPPWKTQKANYKVILFNDLFFESKIQINNLVTCSYLLVTTYLVTEILFATSAATFSIIVVTSSLIIPFFKTSNTSA